MIYYNNWKGNGYNAVFQKGEKFRFGDYNELRDFLMNQYTGVWKLKLKTE